MLPAPAKPAIPVTGATVVRHYAEIFRSQGAPVAQLLENAGIRPEHLDIPGAVVPLKHAYRFAGAACDSLQSEHLGLSVGLTSSLEDFGSYGNLLQTASTFGNYLEKGIALYHTLTTGERFWLSGHGPEIRLNITSPGDVGLGMYQSHLSTIAVTIAICRKAIGQTWSPGEIGLAYRSRENIAQFDLFAGSRIVSGLTHSYISFPRTAMYLRLPRSADTNNPECGTVQPLPTTFIGLVERQIQALIADGRRFSIETVAESLVMSRRSLQRAIANEGLNYFQVLSDIRFRQAAYWLDCSDRSVTEIALALGYTEATNFARAFRRRTGLSPRAFRDAALRAQPVPVAHQAEEPHRVHQWPHAGCS